MSDHSESTRAQVRSTLEHALAQVHTTEMATAIVQRMIELAGQDSEADRTERARHERTPSLDLTARVAEAGSEVEDLATLLAEIATRALAGGTDGKEVAEAAWEMFAPGTSAASAATQQGAALLRAAVIECLHMPEILDARVFLAIRSLPHPTPMLVLCEAIGKLATSGGIWAIGVGLAHTRGIERSEQALTLLAPALGLAGFVAEQPAKAYFARRRSFRHLVAMMVLGVKPRVPSFPSGHAATSFASALSLGAVWPKRRPAFVLLASIVSFSRVYLGLHGPDEILAGGALGAILAELLRSPMQRLVQCVNSSHRRAGRAAWARLFPCGP
jgi:undecaprenyl-diphosphatase